MANNNQSNRSNTSNRGFASMDEDQQREIARKGGQSVAPENRSFSKDHELAREAGAKGGHASHGGRNNEKEEGNSRRNAGGGNAGNFANDRERAREAGQKGGSR